MRKAQFKQEERNIRSKNDEITIFLINFRYTAPSFKAKEIVTIGSLKILQNFNFGKDAYYISLNTNRGG